MDEKELDTLKSYGTEFQNKCIGALLTDRAFIERIADILSPDYFETSAQKWVVEKTIKYFFEFHDVPSPTVMTIYLREIDEQMKLLKQSVGDLLGIAFGHCTDSDLKFVKEQFLDFCRKRTLASAILKSVDLLKVKEYDSIQNVINTALRAGMERNLGHNYFLDVDKRMAAVARNCIKTGWELIDSALDGGLGKGELGFIVAPAGSGKTWLLTAIGAHAQKQGKTVLHITLELNEEYVGLRYDACHTGIAFQDVRKHIDSVKKKLDTIPGKLFIKYFPLKTVSPSSIKLFIERLEMLNQIKIDLLIVDYADILRSFMPDKNANSYTEAGSVYEELRQIAGELQIPVWSASQSNRCLSLQTIVNKKVTGNIEIGKLKKGDKILTNNGYKKVSYIHSIKTQPVYKIRLKSGKEIKCSSNHRFPVLYGKIKSIENGLSIGDKLFTRKRDFCGCGPYVLWYE